MCLIHTYIYMNIIILWWWDVMRTRWWLRSTTDSYERPVIEVVYGKTMIHSTEVVWEILTRGEWLGYRHDASPMFDISESTPVWALYLLFFDFQDINFFTYYVFKSIRIIKEHWWFLTSPWSNEVQRKFSIA